MRIAAREHGCSASAGRRRRPIVRSGTRDCTGERLRRPRGVEGLQLPGSCESARAAWHVYIAIEGKCTTEARLELGGCGVVVLERQRQSGRTRECAAEFKYGRGCRRRTCNRRTDRQLHWIQD